MACLKYNKPDRKCHGLKCGTVHIACCENETDEKDIGHPFKSHEYGHQCAYLVMTLIPLSQEKMWG